MALSPGAQAFLPLVQAHLKALEALAQPSILVRESRSVAVASARFFPKHPARCASCGDEMGVWAQFWAEGRLWRFQRCTRPTDDCDCPMAVLDSASEADGLAEGEAVEGNSAWLRSPVRLVGYSDSASWATNVAIQDLAGVLREPEDWDEFQEALIHSTGAFAGPFGADSHLGGPILPIQSEPRPHCHVCDSAMRFLGQVGHSAGFVWADNGEAYFFACAEHPDQTYVELQTH